jgi:hypothetical protein
MVWAVGHALRGVGGIALGVFGAVRGMPYLVVVAAFLVMESIPAVVWIGQVRTAAQSTPKVTAAAAEAVKASRRSVPAGRLDQQRGRHAESVGVLHDLASPNLVRPQQAAQ